MIFPYLFLAVLGLVTGSFLGMLTYRLPRDLSLGGRSFCDKCRNPIPFFVNIPVFYYIVSGGRCYKCKERIGLRYPLIETVTASTFLLTAYLWNVGNGDILILLKQSFGALTFPLILLLVTCFLSLLIIDLEHTILPDSLLVVLGIIVGLFLLLSPAQIIFSHIFWGFLTFSFFLALYLVTRGRGMGFGDVKMSLVLGSFFGFPETLVWLFLSFLSGAVIGVLMLLFKKARVGQPIPFGPFLLASAFVTIFFGEAILKLYLGMM